MSRSAPLSAPWRRRWRALAATLLLIAAGAVQAQSDADDSADPPSRVARLSYIAGDLGFLPSGATDWSDANINRPLTTGDKLSTARDARAELEFGGGTLRIDGQTNLGLLDLNDDLAQIELTQGTLSLTVRRLDEGQSYEIDTPTVALVVDQPGTFRVDIDDRDGSTRVTALDGGATVFGENSAQRAINPGRSYRFTDSTMAAVTITDVSGGDAFDRWASERDERYAQSASSQYVSEEVVGYQDLDQYGDWQDTGEYGPVWFPQNMGANWAPYRNGHWAYIAPWGWSWVDDAPWGFAPYHYGRWAHTHGGWGWIPGPRGVRPVYAPALVAFVGGGGWSIGIGSAPVGWFPLGPGEIYNPWYRCGHRCYSNVNIRNIRVRHGHDPRRDIDNHYNRYRRGEGGRGDHYVNRNAPRGFTAMPGRSFASGGHVQRDLLRVDPRKLTDASMPTRRIDQLRPLGNGQGNRSSRNAHARNLPTGGFNRQVVARRAPPVVAHDAAGPGGKLAGAPRTSKPRNNVRVLDGADRFQRGARPSTNARNGNDRVVADKLPSRSTMPRQLPQVPRITTAVPQGNPSTPREDRGEMRSARFAHPRDRERSEQPRPGVSYISGNRENAPSPRASTLPQVPRIQRATPADRNSPPDVERIRAERASRYQPTNRSMPREITRSPTPAREAATAPRFQPHPDAPGRDAAEPRFQRPTPRSYIRENPRPAPAPVQRASTPQPRPQVSRQPQRSAPPPRAQESRPQRSESRQPRKSMDRVREDARQH